MKQAKLMRYEWMVRYTPQTEWIEGKGVLLWLAFFFSEMGAGIYFVSLFLNFKAGWLVGWIMTMVLGGIAHIGFLGHPMRSWRILLKPANSELCRGLWAILLFGVIGFFQIVPLLLPGLPWTGNEAAMKTILGIFCILIISHGFLTMNVVRALPLWNSSMIIPFSLASGIWVGSQAVEFMLMLGGQQLYVAELWSRWSLLGYMASLLVYLWGTYHSSDAARESTKRLLTGESALRFYCGVLVIGILIPFVITLIGWQSSVERLGFGLLLIRFAAVLIGDLTMRYNIMKSAVYAPLI